MTENRLLEPDPLRLHPHYLQGRHCIEEHDWQAAAQCFQSALAATPRGAQYHNLYKSCSGLAMVFCGQRGAVTLCRNAAAEEAYDTEVLENLARVELRCGHRRYALAAIRRGLAMDRHARGLLRLRQEIGVRRRPVLPFLGRNHPFNRWLGRLRYRLQPPSMTLPQYETGSVV